jgi:YhcH/YjgK/YiaL family protein
MILDILENAKLYIPLHNGFLKAFEFLKRPSLTSLQPGRHEIDGERVFALISKGPGRMKPDGKLETHRKFIDIQYIIAGADEMGWKPGSACTTPAGPYDPEKDIQFFNNEPDAWVLVHAGAFAIFFPEDAHLPLISRGAIHKVVVKVAV